MSDFDTVRIALGKSLQSYKSDLNVYDHMPRTFVPPAAIVKPRSHRMTTYERAMGGGTYAQYHFIVQFIIGLVNENAAQDEAGQLISPNSPLIWALQDTVIPNGFVNITDGAVSEMMVTTDTGTALYTYAEIALTVDA